MQFSLRWRVAYEQGCITYPPIYRSASPGTRSKDMASRYLRIVARGRESLEVGSAGRVAIWNFAAWLVKKSKSMTSAQHLLAQPLGKVESSTSADMLKAKNLPCHWLQAHGPGILFLSLFEQRPLILPPPRSHC